MHKSKCNCLIYCRADAAQGGVQSQGLLATKDQEWWDFRRKVQQPMLKPRSTHHYTPLLGGIAQSFIDELVRPKLDAARVTPDEFMDDLFRWALESVGLLALNTRFIFANFIFDANKSKYYSNIAY